MFFILLISLVVPSLTSNDINKRLLLHGDQDVLTEFQRLSVLVDQLVREKNETDTKLRSLESRAALVDHLMKEKNESDNKFRSLEHRTSQLESSLGQMQTKVSSTSGMSTYVRWGRTSCPGNGTEPVFSGFIGGSWYGNSGGAANHVCLSKKPLWGHYDDAVGSAANIFGTEYQFDGETSYASAYFGQNLHDNDAVCAVCVTQRSTNIMVPGRNKCTAGWTEEYHGYLVSGNRGHAKASEYICLDESPEVVVGSSRNSNGNILDMVEGICGSLPCPPYVNGREITCVVCSK